MYIENDPKLAFKDVLIRPKRSTLSSRSEVSLERHFTFLHAQKKWSGVPIMAANMDHTGTHEMAQALAKNHLITALHKFYSFEEQSAFLTHHTEVDQFTFISSGTSDQDFTNLSAVINNTNHSYVCLDVANGYSQHFVDFVKKVRDTFPELVIMAGNVVTGEMTEELILSGADIVKVGIGPGSVCTTRKKTGVGYPQLSAVIECSDAAHGVKGLTCSDGGCTVPGDVAKAFGAGADFVMLGGMLAGHDECSGEVYKEGDALFKRFYGMSSAEAMQKYRGGVANYRASEGKSVNIPYRGPVDKTIMDILGGLRSTCTYVGAVRLKELSKRTTFIKVSIQLNDIFHSFEVS